MGKSKKRLFFLCAIYSTLILFFAGFFCFLLYIKHLQKSENLQPADALIVLTGAPKRIDEGLKLLEKKFGKKLLISGVGRNTHKQTLIAQHGHNELFLCCVDLGYQAHNTYSNALESIEWMKNQHYHSAIIITHDYHMPRAMLELNSLCHNIKFVPHLMHDKREQRQSLIPFKAYRLLLSEYGKFVGTFIASLWKGGF